MATEVSMPKMGYDMESGKILRWLKQEGDPVAKGDAIAEIETDKVAIEIEAFASGILARILVPAGADAPVGSPIGWIAQPGEALPDAGTLPAVATPSSVEASEVKATLTGTSASSAAATAAGERIKASPLARRIAQDRSIDLGSISGTGPGGRIVKRDVEAIAAPVVALEASSPVPASVSAIASGVKPFSAMRKAIARRMVESKSPVPHFYVTMAVLMDEALALRQRINEKLAKEDRISVNDLIIKACALALRKHPGLQAVYTPEGLQHPDTVSISVAVALEDGLIAPDIHDADIKSVGAIGKEVRDKAGRARSGGLAPEEYGRGTFTVSNLGMYGVESFTAIITLPQSAAIAVGAVAAEAVVKDGQLAIGQVMRFTVSADHRITDGAGSAQFAAEVKRLLENPYQLLL
jgi:pyruvate dehydrogenase E2 component (dihydrolipoamide acetyltransferase)